MELARGVFKTKLSPWGTIGVLNGLGLGNRPWTENNPVYQSGMWLGFQMMLGPLADLDLTSTVVADRWLGSGFGRICDIFVHEMTHVWQYHRAQWVKTM